eukprot:maker-scaffold594_size129171-snap-gene-0.23 protein:Tk01959 transcript:maker-scaffold594_size129171-snap-gene-0.23-mRNA-1 annotation:"irregular chiasm c-roughest protein isoform x3"
MTRSSFLPWLISAQICIGVVQAADGTKQSFLREPFDQVAKVGEHVTLPCRVVNKQGVLQWTRDDFGLGSDRLLEGFKRYIMTGSDDEGDYTLDINPVSLEDDARFQCQVGAAEGVKPIRSRYASLTVLVPPDPPVIFPMGETYKTVAGKHVEIRCESHGGKPASEITWFDNDRQEVIEDGIQTVQELMEDGKRFKTISILRFEAQDSHNDKSITCQAQNSADRQPKSTSIRLMVHYPPKVALRTNRDELLEGDSVRFYCDTDANPAKVTYAWFVGGKAIRGQDSSELIMDSVDRRHHNSLVRCEATNPIGRSEKTAILNVSYSPVFLNRPENVAGSPGERVSLRCRVDSNPPPTYSWYHINPQTGQRGHLVGSSANLTLLVSPNIVGAYECEASTPGYSDVSATAKLFVKGPPQIVNAHQPQYASLSTTARVVCDVQSVPGLDDIEWSFQGQLIDPRVERPHHGSKYSLTEKRLVDEERIQSSLVIRDVQSQDLGAYMCTVTNALGSDSAVLHLRKQSAMPLLVVIAGVLGGVILTVAVIMIVIVCRRNSKKFHNLEKQDIRIKIEKQKKAEPKEDETSPPVSTVTSSDGVSNNSSDLKVDAGGRTGSSLSEGELHHHHHEDWDGSDDSFRPSGTLGMTRGKTIDYVDGLPRGFEPQMYPQNGFGQYYASNLVNTNYAPAQALAGYATNEAYARSSDNLYAAQPLVGSNGDMDSQQRYAVHVRNSPVSPPQNSAANISVKNYSSSFDYMPASAFVSSGAMLATSSPRESGSNGTLKHGSSMANYRYGNIDNYSVYVNKPHSAGMAPVHEAGKVMVNAAGSSGGSSGKGSLATHV